VVFKKVKSHLRLLGTHLSRLSWSIWGLYGIKWANMGHDSGQIKLKSELRGRAFAQRVFSWSSSSFDSSILLLLHLRKILKLHFRIFFSNEVWWSFWLVGWFWVLMITDDVDGWTVYIAMAIFKYSTSIGILELNSSS